MSFEKRTMKYYHLARTRNAFDLNKLYSTPHCESEYWKKQRDIESAGAAWAKDFKTLSLSRGVDIQLSDEQALACSVKKAKMQHEKELIFERVRKADYPDKPSRKSCMFLCESEDQIKLYAKQFGFQRPPFTIFEIECQEILEDLADDVLKRSEIPREIFNEMRQPNRHRVNPDFLACNVLTEVEIEEMARKYWRGEKTGGDALTEVLFRGFFKVTRLIES